MYMAAQVMASISCMVHHDKFISVNTVFMSFPARRYLLFLPLFYHLTTVETE